MLVTSSKMGYNECLLVAQYGIMWIIWRWRYMKKCKCRYWDRWHSEWVCSRYDAPIRVCCPCGRPDIEKGSCEGELELFKKSS